MLVSVLGTAVGTTWGAAVGSVAGSGCCARATPAAIANTAAVASRNRLMERIAFSFRFVVGAFRVHTPMREQDPCHDRARIFPPKRGPTSGAFRTPRDDAAPIWSNELTCAAHGLRRRGTPLRSLGVRGLPIAALRADSTRRAPQVPDLLCDGPVRCPQARAPRSRRSRQAAGRDPAPSLSYSLLPTTGARASRRCQPSAARRAGRRRWP